MGALGALGVATLTGCSSASADPSRTRRAAAAPACTLIAEQEEGPFYVHLAAIRSDITEGKPGIPLKLRLTIVDSTTCEPIPNAAVDIWHCDASGVYSGVASEKTTYLRGVQVTDARGVAQFGTIVPGAYQGRATHIHLKVHVAGSVHGAAYSGGHVSHTGQLFFPGATLERVAAVAPYSSNTARMANELDHIWLHQGGRAATLTTVSNSASSVASGLTAALTLGIAG